MELLLIIGCIILFFSKKNNECSGGCNVKPPTKTPRPKVQSAPQPKVTP